MMVSYKDTPSNLLNKELIKDENKIKRIHFQYIEKRRIKIGSLAQLNRAFDYGSKGYRFESCASHFKKCGNSRNTKALGR